jgi:muramoyltetrapeptide carboxypeptidase
VASFHGPNLDQVKTRKSLDSLRSAIMKSAILPDIGPELGELQVDYPYVPVSGVAGGPFIGGSLSAIASLFGTPFEPPLAGGVLFLTDRDERNDILERWLTTINVSGQLAKVAAVVFGQFDNCGNKGSANLLSLEDSFGDTMKELGLPSCFDFPIAGGADFPTVPIGVSVNMDTTNRILHFLEAATI